MKFQRNKRYFFFILTPINTHNSNVCNNFYEFDHHSSHHLVNFSYFQFYFAVFGCQYIIDFYPYQIICDALIWAEKFFSAKTKEKD